MDCLKCRAPKLLYCRFGLAPHEMNIQLPFAFQFQKQMFTIEFYISMCVEYEVDIVTPPCCRPCYLGMTWCGVRLLSFVQSAPQTAIAHPSFQYVHINTQLFPRKEESTIIIAILT